MTLRCVSSAVFTQYLSALVFGSSRVQHYVLKTTEHLYNRHIYLLGSSLSASLRKLSPFWLNWFKAGNLQVMPIGELITRF